MNLAGYLRVSTQTQADDGAGLDVQRDAIVAWCRKHRHHVTTWHVDEGISGSNGLDTRAGLADALAMLEHDAQGIVTYRLDRLARSLALQESILADVAKHGGHVFSTSDTENAYLEDPDADPDPTRALVRQILGAVAEYERAMIRARMLAGQRRKAAAGGYAAGAPPYGWRAQSGELVPVPAEQAQLDVMLALRAGGDSLRRICQVLDASGVPPRRGQRWHPKVVAEIIEREQKRRATSG